MKQTRPQQRESTRRAIVAATLTSLARRGYAGTTIASIAGDIGLSRGAMLHHFPTKVELVTGAIRDELNIVKARLARDIPGFLAQPDPVGAALDRLYEEFSGVLASASLAAEVAARGDPDLDDALTPLFNELRSDLDQWAPLVLRDQPVDSIPQITRFVMAVLRGIMIEEPLDADGPRNLETWLFAREFIVKALREG
ncbi:MAG: TetR/AcrR family transcriptional regulator [Mycobacterium sp.]